MYVCEQYKPNLPIIKLQNTSSSFFPVSIKYLTFNHNCIVEMNLPNTITHLCLPDIYTITSLPINLISIKGFNGEFDLLPSTIKTIMFRNNFNKTIDELVNFNLKKVSFGSLFDKPFNVFENTNTIIWFKNNKMVVETG